MRQTAARFINCERIDCRLVIHIPNLAVHIHDIRNPVAHTVRAQDTVGFRHFAITEIAQECKRHIELISKDLLRRRIVRADPKNYRIVPIEFSDTSLVRGEFFGSTTGESSREKSQHYRLFAFIIGQSDFTAPDGGQREIRRCVSNLEQVIATAWLLRNQRAAKSGAERNGCSKPHVGFSSAASLSFSAGFS
jgi:hypothetical protein